VKAKEMTLTVSRTFVGEPAGLRRFESLKVEAGLTVEIEEGDTAEKVRQHIIEELRKSLSDSYRAFHPRYRNENRQLSS
jgi:hypothetical protein